MLPPPIPQWALLDLDAVGKALHDFTLLLCPPKPMPSFLSRWFDISSTHLTSLLTSHAPSRCPEQMPAPPLEAVVLPPPIVPEKGISQVCEDIPPRPVPPQLEQC